MIGLSFDFDSHPLSGPDIAIPLSLSQVFLLLNSFISDFVELLPKLYYLAFAALLLKIGFQS